MEAYPRHIFGGNLYFGGGPDPVPPPAPSPVPAQVAPDSEAAKKKVSMADKRRVGATDASRGGILGALGGKKPPMATTLGGTGGSYTGEA